MRWNPEFTLRDYQKRLCRSACDGFTTGIAEGNRIVAGPFSRQLLVAATGSGKTIIAAAIAQWNHARGGKTLMLAHTDELCSQARDKIQRATGEWSSIEKSSERASLDAPIVTGSFQSFGSGNRIDRFPPNHFALVIADEAHLSMAETFQKTLRYFNDGGARILGITATPSRADEISLMRFYENVADEIGMAELISAGHLAPLKVQTCPISIDVSGVDLNQAGDNDALADVISPYYEAIIDQWMEHARQRPTVCFHPTRYSSKAFTELLLKRGIRAEHVDGESKDRAQVIQRFADGKTHFLNNAQLLVAGWDEPRVECVINLRLTRHRTPYMQIIGRGTRLREGKADCLILDMLWQFQDIDIMRPVDVFADTDEEKEIAQERANNGEQADLLALSMDAQREREQKLVDRMRANAGKKGYRCDVREFAAAMHQQELINYRPRAQWEADAITGPQRVVLEKWGVDADTVTSKGLATKLMNHRIKAGLATYKQVSMLRDLGVDFDLGTTTIQSASKMINAATKALVRT